MCLSLCVCVCALAHPFMLLCVYVCACFPEDDVFMELLLSCLYVGSMTEFRVSGLLSYLVSPLIAVWMYISLIFSFLVSNLLKQIYWGF